MYRKRTKHTKRFVLLTGGPKFLHEAGHFRAGMICDGAKASCAAKIASAVEAGLLGMQMQMHDSEFVGGDGIVVKGVENTIRNVGRLAHDGMAETDREIIRLMIAPGC